MSGETTPIQTLYRTPVTRLPDTQRPYYRTPMTAHQYKTIHRPEQLPLTSHQPARPRPVDNQPDEEHTMTHRSAFDYDATDAALNRLRAVAGSDTTAYLEAVAKAAAAGVTPWQLDLIAQATATRPAPPLRTKPLPMPQPTDRLPLLCRLRRHTWRRQPVRGGWIRDTCNRCRHLDVPTPTR